MKIKDWIFYIICMIAFSILIIQSASAAPIMESSSVISTTVSGDSGDTSPSSETSSTARSGTTSGGSGFTCNNVLWIDTDYCKTFCPKYIKLNNCSKKPTSLNLCCIMYYKENITIINNDTIMIDTKPTEEVKQDIVQDTQPDDKKDYPIMPIIFLFVAAILCVITIFYIRKPEEQQEEFDPQYEFNYKR